MAPPLRIYLTLSGGASLGAYEAGAASAVALASRYLDAEEGQETTVDAIGGASAGALVSMFTAHALLEGLDPVELLHEAWVERVTLPLLLSDDSRSLLAFDELREKLPEVLAPDGPAKPSADAIELRQDRRIAVHVQLTGLRGLTYPIRGLREDAPVTGVTYTDWGRFDLEPGGGLEQIVEPQGSALLDFVLASAASPGGFAPRLLDRRADYDGYRGRGIGDLPESGTLWYTDGGLLGSQPLGRVIAAGRALHGSGEGSRGVHLLIDPRSEHAEADTWADPDAEPSWPEGIARALGILSEQSLFDDLRRIEKDNSRIEWAERLADALSGRLKKGSEKALREFIDTVESEREGMRSDEPHRERPGDDGDELRELLLAALNEVGGLAGKERVAIDVISPLMLADSEGEVGSLLAGEFMGDFGGFLSRDLRASDFALGYESTLAWLGDGLAQCELADDVVERTVAFVEHKRRYDPDQVREGRAELGDLSVSDRLQLVRLGLHAARVLGSGVLDWRSRIPDGLGAAIERARATLPGSR